MEQAGNMHVLRCYAEGRPGAWEAVCLDFDLAVQGESLEDVLGSLKKAIGMYLETVHELPEEERKRFLNRRAPLSLRLKFLWHVVRSVLANKDGPDRKARAEFLIPCPA